MGGCLSSESCGSDIHSSRNQKSAPANVVSVNGELRQYSLPTTVSQVLQSQTQSSSSPSDSSFFLCNSDRLNFDDYIPSLDPQEDLEPAQIYFVLPTTKLQYRLSASDMAALAVKASVALEHINANNSNHRGRKRKIRISPVLVSGVDRKSSHATVNYNQIMNSLVLNHYRDRNVNNASRSTSAGLGVSRSGSVRKLARYSSRRAKLAVRSFKLKLTTIYEGSVLLVT
ncbi:hypothetical protein CDL12_28629 [Handroanthus impetiginosus]|uniref:Uncharacterized protein n=1 Tax=Handroanthus impetiginosus TaxID=429701 RepID=A0A2G9G0N4_9LAMI|nr:hypothetical protein CDL12_28629 [Handroanthus impetiginosus]